MVIICSLVDIGYHYQRQASRLSTQEAKDLRSQRFTGDRLSNIGFRF